MTDAQRSQSSELPLAGLAVIELHAIGPVPFAGQLLRSLGAEVVRVSPPDDPGLGVAMRPEHDVLNAGKTTLHLNLKDPDGLEALHARLARADLLIEGFRPGVLERLGLAPDTLAARHPRLVIGRLSGWGSTGPLAPRAGHDINYLAMAGVLNAVGTAGQPLPPLNLVADFGGGAMHLLVGVLARLVRRGIDGRGGVVETSILAGTVGLTGMFYGLLAGAAWNLGREANLLDGARPFYRVYRCADDRFVAVGALEPKFWRQLLELLGLDGEIDPADQYREASWPATAERLARRFGERSRDEWAALAEPVDACLSPVLDFLEAARHPHNLANRLYRAEPFPQPGAVLDFAPDR
ncbi:CaiB/BaiF CoA transferase family protein [Zeimonas arvi]|uniref:CoA transferase n=1 Tax=Zeimonas arvi TaxID=2498847 RepID=A0A5C8NU15_9BURK|nr:CaiB/BaiF CoA-transferase family protein [Zeimonas arvi]TXL64653.1 CoA transferase [Zeimonas arvi]